MKRNLFSCLVISFFALMTVTAQSPSQAKDPAGKWKFTAPSAPEGLTAGNIEVSFADKVYKVAMSFSESDYKLDGDKVSFEQDTLKFNIYVQGQEVTVILKMTEPVRMEGFAFHPEGEVSLILVKDQPKS